MICFGSRILVWSALLLIASSLPCCIPARVDADASGGSATVDDAADDDAQLPDATSITDAGDAKIDTGKADTVALITGCTKNDDCASFTNSCQDSTCDTATGKCAVHDLDEGTPCVGAQGDNCLASATCQGGECRVKGLSCDDGNTCTVDSCDPAVGCVHTSAVSTWCDDGNACTLHDGCMDGECKKTVGTLDCDDKNLCTDDVCDPVLGCTHTAKSASASCDDGKKCTLNDNCGSGVCKGTPKVCPDADNNPCTLEACSELVLSNDGCSSNLPDSPLACSDGDPCTIGDQCSASGCLPGKANSCDDKNPCTDDACVKNAGCKNTPNDTSTCTKDACTPGVCSAGLCQSGSANCDDGNVCTADSCDATKGGCMHLPAALSCSDGDPCTAPDPCVGTVCTPGPLVSCDDGDPCTSDQCTPSGCTYALEVTGTPCGLTADQKVKSCVAGACVVEDACNDYMCSATEAVGSCPKDCSKSDSSGCAANDATCLGNCQAASCGDLNSACGNQAGCGAIQKCLDSCSNSACKAKCMTNPMTPAAQAWLKLNACTTAQCAQNDWLGKPCTTMGGPAYVNCLDACTWGFCAAEDLACQTDASCVKTIDCVAQCALSDSACVGACGAKAPLYDHRNVCIQKHCL